MKKTLSLLLAVMLLFTMCACSLTKTEVKYELVDAEDVDEIMQGNEEIDGDGDADANASGDAQGSQGSQGGSNGADATSPSGVKTLVETFNYKDKDGKYRNSYLYNNGKMCDLKNVDVDFSNPSLFEGDGDRLYRIEIGEAYVTYKMDDGIYEFFATCMFTSNDLKLTDDFTFLVSPDGKTWSAVTTSNRIYKPINGNSWVLQNLVFKGIDSSNKYLKVIFPKTGSVNYNPNLAYLQINGLDEKTLDQLGGSVLGATSKTIYIDSKNGNDRNDGKSEAKPLKTLNAASKKVYNPGDKVLLKSGQTFSGSLEVKGTGASGKPIKISSYGSGAKPIINGRGGSALKFYGAYIEVTGLQITNKAGELGIQGYALAPGATKGVKINNCDFKEINLQNTVFTYSTGGITLVAGGYQPSWYDGTIIENNTFNKVARCPIFISSEWAGRESDQEWGHRNAYVNDNNGWYPNRNISIRKNTMTNNGGDSILLIGAKDSVVEYNISRDSARFKNGSQVHYAGMWCHSSNNIIFQYNEVSGIRGGNSTADLMAFDADISCKNIIFQYNYSHDNDGGAFLVCGGRESVGGQTTGTIIRYNLSVNDNLKDQIQAPIFTIVNGVKNTQIYNNTVYTDRSGSTLVRIDDYQNDTDPSGTVFKNNIFAAKEAGIITPFFTHDLRNLTIDAIFDTNIFYNIAEPNSNGIVVKNSLIKDPGFTKPGKDENGLSTAVKDYTPKNSLSGALAIANNGGKDIIGTKTDGTKFGAIAK